MQTVLDSDPHIPDCDESVHYCSSRTLDWHGDRQVLSVVTGRGVRGMIQRVRRSCVWTWSKRSPCTRYKIFTPGRTPATLT